MQNYFYVDHQNIGRQCMVAYVPDFDRSMLTWSFWIVPGTICA